MLTFDFVCNSCREAFEAFVSTGPDGSREPVACPACGSGEVARQVSGFALRTSARRRGRVVDLSSGGCPVPGHRHGLHRN